jgi:hypothetical protein
MRDPLGVEHEVSLGLAWVADEAMATATFT